MTTSLLNLWHQLAEHLPVEETDVARQIFYQGAQSMLVSLMNDPVFATSLTEQQARLLDVFFAEASVGSQTEHA